MADPVYNPDGSLWTPEPVTLTLHYDNTPTAPAPAGVKVRALLPWALAVAGLYFVLNRRI